MQMYSLLLPMIGLLLATASSHPHGHKHRRGIGKASMPIPLDWTTAFLAASTGLTSVNCVTVHMPGHTGHFRSTITTTITVTADTAALNTASAVPPTSAPSSSIESSDSSAIQHSSQSTSATPFDATRTGSSAQIMSSSTSTSIAPFPTASIAPNCATVATNKTDMPGLIGFNVVNQKLVNPNATVTGYKGPEDWDAAFSLLKNNFAQINAVRTYSTTDDGVMHLMNALPAAENHDLMILVGVWSGGPQNKDRFEQEKQALIDAINVHGCDHIAAISVGNEDLYSVNLQGLTQDQQNRTKTEVAGTLIDQIQQIRNIVRESDCCMPVTHTDTSNEWTTTDQPWVSSLIQACDQAVIANVFPYWTNVTIAEAFDSLKAQSYVAMNSAKSFSKDVWLGETGWPISQPIEYNRYGTDARKAQQYFQQIGCQVLTSNGTGFYYVDWDQDAPKQGRPSFGLFDFEGRQLIEDLSCDGFKSDMSLADWDNHLPDYMGRSQRLD